MATQYIKGLPVPPQINSVPEAGEYLKRLYASLSTWSFHVPVDITAGTYEPVITAGTTAQYWRGDKSWQTLQQSAVAGLTISDSPTWASATLSSTTTAPYLQLVNASGTARDPVIQWAVGASPVVKWTFGLDDSDADQLKLSWGSSFDTDVKWNIAEFGVLGTRLKGDVSIGLGGWGSVRGNSFLYSVWDDTEVAWLQVTHGDDDLGEIYGKANKIEFEALTDTTFSSPLTSFTGTIAATQGTFNIAVGTAPLVITSTTLCSNLNADLWDGYQFADYLNQAVKTTSSPTFANITDSGLTAGRVPFVSTGGLLADSTKLQWDNTNQILSVYGKQSTATLGDELVTDGAFSGADLSAWGSPAGWSLSSGKALHASGGGTAPLTQNISVTNGATYQVEFTIAGRTTGSVSLTIGAVSLINEGAVSTFSSNTTFKKTMVSGATGSIALSIIPTDTFNGSIDSVIVRLVSLNSSIPIIRGYDDTSTVSFELFFNSNANLGVGRYAQDSITVGISNTAFGFASQYVLTTGSYNVAIGQNAQYKLTNGHRNVAIGQGSQYSMTNGSYNTANGQQSQYSITSGSYNVAIGQQSEYSLVSGNYNVANGVSSLYSLLTGTSNTALGYAAQYFSTTGIGNVNIGSLSGYGSSTANAPVTDNYGILIGFQSNRSVASSTQLTNYVGIGYGTLVDKSNQVKIGNSSIVETILYGNIGLNGQATFGTSGAGVMALATGTAPTTSPADAIQIYSADYGAGDARMFMRGESGYPMSMGNQSLCGGDQASGNLTLRSTSNATKGIVYSDSKVRSTGASLYRRYYHIPLTASNPGASGATWVAPGANTTGGWNLTSATNYLDGETDIHTSWDASSDLKFECRFAVNVDNSGGGAGDTVDLRLQVFYKGIGDTACKSQIIEVATVIGASARYKQFKVVFPIDYDYASNVVEVNDIMSFRLNLETDTSEVDDIVLSDMSVSYLTTHVGIEDGDE